MGIDVYILSQNRPSVKQVSFRNLEDRKNRGLQVVDMSGSILMAVLCLEKAFFVNYSKKMA